MTATARQRERHRALHRKVVSDPVPRDDIAQDVWQALLHAGHDGRSIPELGMDLPQYSLSQIRTGKDYINHIMQEAREQPLIRRSVRGRGEVYLFPKDMPDWQVFTMRQLRGIVTRISTETARGEAAMHRWPEDVPVYIPKMFRRLREDAGALLDELREFMGDDDDSR